MLAVIIVSLLLVQMFHIDEFFGVDIDFGGIFLKSIVLIFSVYLLKVTFSRKPNTGGEIIEAKEYLKRITESDHEYCLILRPFGNDGYFSFRNFFAGDIIDILRNTLAEKNATLEQVIESKGKEILNIDSVALVDSSSLIVPTSPRFISTSNRVWKHVVLRLLKRAYVVVLIIPPDTEIRESLIWELQRVAQYGLIGRTMILFPPPKNKTYKNTINSFKKEFSFLSDEILEMPENTFCLYLKDYDQLLSYYPENKRSASKINFSHYSDFLSKAFEMIKIEYGKKSFSEKYPYAYLVDDIEDLTIYDQKAKSLFIRYWSQKKMN